MSLCSGCGAPGVEVIEPGLPSFRHLDFASLIGAGRFLSCDVCGLITNAESSKHAIVDPVFTSQKYATSAQTSQQVQTDEGKLTRSAIQARWIVKNLEIDNWRVLDIGCYDGALLRELGELNTECELHGFDVNPHLETFFDDIPRARFHTGRLEDLAGAFDLILASHSLIYVPELRAALSAISRIKSDLGIFIVQVPDISTNPYSFTLGDQRYYFTAASLGNVLAANHFHADRINLPEFPREAAYMATSSERQQRFISQEHAGADMIADLVKTRSLLDEMPGGSYAVLGTTVNAAFVDAVLGDRLMVFADENENRIGTTFRGKPVIHPASLKNDTKMLLPFGQSSEQIKSHMAEITKAELIAL